MPRIWPDISLLAALRPPWLKQTGENILHRKWEHEEEHLHRSSDDDPFPELQTLVSSWGWQYSGQRWWLEGNPWWPKANRILITCSLLMYVCCLYTSHYTFFTDHSIYSIAINSTVMKLDFPFSRCDFCLHHNVYFAEHCKWASWWGAT